MAAPDKPNRPPNKPSGQGLRPAPVSPCRTDPDRWVYGRDDPELKRLCRSGCPRRWRCANEALHTPGVRGLWSGVYVPGEGRARRFAMRQLRALAIHGGYPVHSTRG